MLELKIDPEFRDKIPPLTDAEYEQLRENILSAGEIYEPIVTWNGVIVDGHNRYRVYRENPKVKYRTREMDFPDKWAAFEWMYKNQLGRRNLTDEQRTYMIGKMYEARKNSVGNGKSERAENGTFQKSQIATNGRPLRTDELVGEELGVNHATVHRSYRFAKGVDAIKEVSPVAANKILRGEANTTKSAIGAVAKLGKEEQAVVAKAIERGNRYRGEQKQDAPVAQIPTRIPTNNKTLTDEIYSQMRDTGRESTFDLDDLCEEIRVNGDDYVRSLRTTISIRTVLLSDKEARDRVVDEIHRIIGKIQSLEGLVNERQD